MFAALWMRATSRSGVGVRRLEGVGLGVRPRRRRLVALDETRLRDAGQQFHVWAAIDVKTKELLAIRHLDRGAS